MIFRMYSHCGYIICNRYGNTGEVLFAGHYDNSRLLPPAYVVRGKVIFILGNVCLFTIGWGGDSIPGLGGGGYPVSGVGEGYPVPGLDGGGYPGYPFGQDWMVGGYLGYPPWPVLDGGGRGTPGTPHHDWMGYPPPWLDGVPPTTMTGRSTPLTLWLDGVPPTSIASTCYTAGGMPLAFTQEDFLVIIDLTDECRSMLVMTVYTHGYEKWSVDIDYIAYCESCVI